MSTTEVSVTKGIVDTKATVIVTGTETVLVKAIVLDITVIKIVEIAVKRMVISHGEINTMVAILKDEDLDAPEAGTIVAQIVQVRKIPIMFIVINTTTDLDCNRASNKGI